MEYRFWSISCLTSYMVHYALADHLIEESDALNVHGLMCVAILCKDDSLNKYALEPGFVIGVDMNTKVETRGWYC